MYTEIVCSLSLNLVLQYVFTFNVYREGTVDFQTWPPITRLFDLERLRM